MQSIKIDAEVLRTVIRQELASGSGLLSSDDILSLKDAATYLRTTVGYLYQLVHKRRIPFIKRTGKLFFSKSQLQDWLKEGSQEVITP